MSSEESKPVASGTHPKQKQYLMRLTAFFLFLGVLYFIYWFIYSRHYEKTDNAYVNGNIIPVSSQIGGIIIAVKVSDTAFVKAGEPVVLLDATDREIALEHAKANLALVLRQTQQLYIKDKGLLATIQARELTLKQADSDLKRRQQAIHIGGVSQEELTHAQNNYNITNSLLTTARSEWSANKALISGTSLTAHPQVQQAMAGVKEAYLALLRTKVRAPVSGYIAKRSAQVGQLIAPGTFLMALVPLDDIWVDANFKERQLGKIRPGQAVTLEADIYGSAMTYHGRVVGFSGGTGSAFSLLPAQNATGNWIKVVQRLPVRIVLDAQELKEHPLRIGLSMNVIVDTNTKEEALKAIDLDSANKTAIFNGLDKGADVLIERIVKDNFDNNEMNKVQLLQQQGACS
jgi:membrane fusion protein (multidrug efflux system)